MLPRSIAVEFDSPRSDTVAKRKPTITAKKPKSALLTPVKPDWNKLIVAVAKGAVPVAASLAPGAAALTWTAVAPSALDAAAAIGLKRGADEQAWTLIHRAMARALIDLLNDSVPLSEVADRERAVDVAEKLDAALKLDVITIDADFFEHPDRLKFCEEIQAPFARWLTQGCQIPAKRAEAIAARIPGYFTLALRLEWAEKPNDYALIEKATKTPFDVAAEHEHQWMTYTARLIRQVDESVFDEAFGLRQIFVPLRAFYSVAKDDKGVVDLPMGMIPKRNATRHVVMLDEAVDAWLEKGDKNDAIRLVSGGPGSGKSSFAKMYAAKQSQLGKIRTIFVHLHRFSLTGTLSEAIGTYLRGEFKQSPLDVSRQGPKLLLIFDGLDELQATGGLGARLADEFLLMLRNELHAFNMDTARLRVLITGRVTAVQELEEALRVEDRTFHVLPYFVAQADAEQYFDPLGLLKPDQRDQWWKQYGELTGSTYTGLPKELHRPDLVDVTREPLLNYLLAMALAGKMRIPKDFNLNQLYHQLFDQVYKRAYEKRVHPVGEKLTADQFRQVMEEVAVACWHGNGRTASVAQISEHCKQSQLEPLLIKLGKHAREGATRLMAAFYFRQIETDKVGDEVFEFTHKSFREYLTASRLLRLIDNLNKQMAANDDSAGSGLSPEEALLKWIRFCGPTSIDPYQLNFLKLGLKGIDGERVAQWQDRFIHLFALAISRGLPMKQTLLTSFAEMERQARNAEEALLVIHSICGFTTGNTSVVPWQDYQRAAGEQEGVPDILGLWLTKLGGQRGGQLGYGTSKLNHLNLSGCQVFNAPWSGEVCQASSFERSRLSMSLFALAQLKSVSFRGARLDQSVFRYVQIDDCDLSGAWWDGSIFASITMSRCNASMCRLQSVSIDSTRVDNCDFSHCVLTGSRTWETVISGCDFSEAVMDGATIGYTQFIDCKLDGANLIHATLFNVTFTNTTCKGTKITRLRADPQTIARLKELGAEE